MNHSLHRRISIPLTLRIAHRDTRIASVRVDDAGLTGQMVISTDFDIVVRHQRHMIEDPREYKLEILRTGALRLTGFGEVDVQPHILGEVGSARFQNPIRHFCRQLRIDLASQRIGTAGVPSSGIAALARECQRWDTSIMRGVARGTNSAGEEYGNTQVRADVGPGDGQIGGSVEDDRREVVDSVAHRGQRVGVYPVLMRIGRIVSVWAAVGRAAVVLAGIITIRWGIVHRSYIALLGTWYFP